MFLRHIHELANTYCSPNFYNKCQLEHFHTESEVFFFRLTDRLINQETPK